jgi:hypothetical protein
METHTLKLTFHPNRPCQTAAEHNGRTALSYHVFGRIGTEDVQSFALIGTEKMGKTSFLNYLHQPEVLANHLQEPQKYLFVYLDAKTQKLEDEPIFFRTLFSQEPFRNLSGLTSIKDLRVLSNWLESQDKRLVVMIDNFNFIVSNPNFRVPFYEGLRSWFSTQRRVGCVVTATLPLLQLAMARELSGSPFFNIFTTYLLEPLVWEEAKLLLTNRLPPHLREREAEIDQLLKEFGTFPYPLQQAGNCWVGMAEHRHIPPLKKVIEAAYQACLGYYENIYSSLKRHQLAVVDGLLDPYQPKPDPDRIDRTLIERGWVSEDGRHIPARQMARFFRTKLGLPESLGSWQKLTIWLNNTLRRTS